MLSLLVVVVHNFVSASGFGSRRPFQDWLVRTMGLAWKMCFAAAGNPGSWILFLSVVSFASFYLAGYYIPRSRRATTILSCARSQWDSTVIIRMYVF
jgi:hypothetical protein